MKNDLLTIQEAAEFFSVSTRTLRRWEDKGYLVAQRTFGNQRRYGKAQLEQLMQSQMPIEESASHSSVSPIPSFATYTNNDFITPEPSQIIPHPTPVLNAAAGYQMPNGKKQNQMAVLLGIFLLLVMVEGFVLASGFTPTWMGGMNQFGGAMTPNEKTANNAGSRVLAAEDVQPAYILKVSVPSVFSNKVTFLDAFEIKNSLTVNSSSNLFGGIKTNNNDIDAGTGRVTASNILYSVLAGSNISITGDPQNPTISATGGITSVQGQTGAVAFTEGEGIGLNGLEIANTGVLSLQGETGDLTFTQGSGISVSGFTISNSDPGSAQKMYSTFRVGSTDISAGSNTDAFTFAAGSGITLTPNAGTKTMTITSDAAGVLSGMTQNGVLYATSPSTATSLTPGVSGYILKSTGASTPPEWVAPGTVLGFVDFNFISSGTNTMANMVVGSGASLNYTGTGTINASSLQNSTWVAPGAIGSTTPNTGAFTALTASTINGLSVTANGSNTLTIAAGKGFTINNTLAISGTDGTAFTFPSASDTLVGRNSTDTLTNKTIAAGSNTISGLTNANLSGTAGIANANLANSSLTVSAGTGLSGGGSVALGGIVTLNNAGVLSITGTANQVNASAATGTVTLSLPQNIHTGATPTFAGATLSSFTTSGGILYTNGSGTIGQTTGGNIGQCLTSSGGGIPTWDNCASASSNVWQSNSGTVSPFSNTLDLLVGGTSTSSAKFAFINNLSGTPTASIAAGTGNNATFIAGNGNIGTTNAMTLVLGTGSTGSVVLSPAGATALTALVNGNVGIGTATPGSSLDVNGNIHLSGGARNIHFFGDNSSLTTNFDNLTFTADADNNGSGSLFSWNGNGSSVMSVTNAGSLNLVNSLQTGGTSRLDASGNLANINSITAGGTITLSGLSAGVVKSNGLGVLSSSAVGLNTSDVTGILAIGNGGTGTASTPSNGQLLIGNGSGYTLAGLTGGTAISVSNGAGSITINNTGVTSALAGTGISVNAATGNVTFTNTGVTSLAGTTNQVSVSGGTGAVTISLPQNIHTGATPTFAGLTLSGLSINGGILYTNGSGTVTQLSAGSLDQCLMSSGVGAPTWSACAANNYWQQNNGTLSPYSSTVDLLIGGTATASAKFAFMNTIGGGTPTASISGNTANVATSLAGDGTLATTNKRTLTIGNSATGNINFNGGSLINMIANYMRLGPIDYPVPFSFANSGYVIVDKGNTASDASLVLRDQGNVRAEIGLVTDNRIHFKTATGTSGSETFTDRFIIDTDGDVFTDNGGKFGVGTEPVEQFHVAADYSSSRLIAKLENTSTGAGRSAALQFDGSSGAIDWLVGTDFGLNGGNNFFIQDNNGSIRQFIDAAGLMAIGGANSSPLATLDLRGNNGTTAIGSASGATSNAAFIVDNNGVGDILAASKSGATKFVVDNAGNVRIANLTTDGGILYTTGTGTVMQTSAGSLSQCLRSNGGGAPVWGTCGTSSADNYWTITNGTVTPFTNSLDLLVGGTSTASAKFAFINSLTGTPTASIAGSTAGAAISLTGDGVLSTTMNRSLVMNPNGGNVGIGTATPTSTLHVVGGARITGLVNCNTIDTDANGVLSCGTDETGVTSNYWQVANGAVSPFSSTLDLLVGSTATSGAKFAVTNMTGSGTPAASISATTTGNGVVIAGDGTLQSLRNNTLTIGGGTTGNIVLSPRNGAGTVQVSGLSTGVVKSNASGVLSSGTVSLANGSTDITGTLSVANGGTGATSFTQGGLLYGNGTSAVAASAQGTAGQVLLSGGTGAPTWTTGALALAGNFTTSGANALTLTTTGATNVTLPTSGTLATLAGTETFTNKTLTTPRFADLGYIADSNGNEFLIFDSVSSAVNEITLGNAATTNAVTLAATGGDTNIPFAIDAKGTGELRLNGTGTGNILLGGGSGSTGCTVTNSNGNFACAGTLSGSNFSGTSSGTNTGDQTITLTGDVSGSGTGSFAVTIQDNSVDGTDIALGSDTQGDIMYYNGTDWVRLAAGTSNQLLHSGTTPSWGAVDLASSDVTGTLPINRGGTNSTATPTNGGIAYGTGTAFAFTSAGSAGQCLQSNGAASPTWGACVGQNYWQVNNGALSPFATADLLIGSTASSSAKFAVLNMTGSGTPMASVSATTSGNGIAIAGDGTLQSLRNNTLTIGGDTTGNIALSPRNGAGTLTANATTVTLAGTTAFTGTSLTSITGGATAIDFSEFDVAAGTGSITINDGGDAGNISIEGTILDINSLDFAGAATITSTGSNNITLSAGTGYVRIGDTATAPTNASGDDDLFVEGDIEADGVIYADGGIDTTFTAGSIIFAGTNGVLAQDNTSFFFDDASNELGIGTVAPESQLEIQGSEGNDAILTLDADDGDDTTDTWFLEAEATDNDLSFVNGTTELLKLTSGGTLQIASGNVFDTLNAGTLGVGTSNATTLTLGRSGQNIALPGYSNCGMLTTSGTTLTCSSAPGGITQYLRLASGAFSFVNDTADFLFGSNASTSAKFRLSSLGTASVASISATTSNATLLVNNFGTGDLFTASASGVPKFVIDTNGRVGIGTSLPTSDLEISSSVNPLLDLNDSADYQMLLRHNIATNGSAAGLGFTVTNTTGNVGAAIIHTRTNTNSMGDLGFYTKRVTTVGADPELAMLIDDQGFVGINTANPDHNLTLNGNLNVRDVDTATKAYRWRTNGASLDMEAGGADLYLSVWDSPNFTGNQYWQFIFDSAGGDISAERPMDVNYITNAATYSLSVGGGIAFTQWNTGIPHVLLNAMEANAGYRFMNGNAAKDLLRLEGDGRAGIGMGAGQNISATLDVRGQIATMAVASVSGQTTHAAMVVDQSGTGDIFTASKSGKTHFTIKNSGVMQIGDNTNGLTFDYMNGGPLYTGTARPTKTITLVPEYAGAIMTASGSANTNGFITSDASPSAATDFRTYYEWSSSQATLQDYTVMVRVPLPEDFSGWDPTSALQIEYNTELTDSTTPVDNKVDVLVYNSGNATPTAIRRNLKTTSKTWTTLTIDDSDLTDGASSVSLDTAGENMLIYLRMYSRNDNYIQIGDITLKYQAKF